MFSSGTKIISLWKGKQTHKQIYPAC